MGLTLIHHDEPLIVENIVAILFGAPGSGKSSLAFTTEKPLCMDFDKGLQRVVGRKLAVRFESWVDALELVDNTGPSGNIIKNEGIKTLICDTAGTMLDDYISGHILKMDVKGVDNGAGGLGLRGYGVMKDIAAKFFNKCKEHKVDIVFVCHSQMQDDGDAKRFFPKMTGGSYDIIMAKSDLVGFMEMQGEKVTLDFNPTSRHDGKNCTQFKKMELPHFTSPEYADFFGKLIQATKDHMRKTNDAMVQAVKQVDVYKEELNAVESIAELEKLRPSIDALSPLYKAQVNQFYNKKLADLWGTENMNGDNLKTPEDFKALEDKIAKLPKTIQQDLREPFKALLDGAGLEFNKDKKAYTKKTDKPAEQPAAVAPAATNGTAAPVADPKPETKKKEVKEPKVPKAATAPKETIAPKATPPAAPATPPSADDLRHPEQWFLDRVGKSIIAKSNKYNGPMKITDENHACHLYGVSQNHQGYIFTESEETVTTEKSLQEQFDNQPEPETVASTGSGYAQ